VARTRTAFLCGGCGHETPRWEGQCPGCGAWNTLVEEPAPPRTARAPGARRPGGGAEPVRLGDVIGTGVRRWSTGMPDVDFVLGGGIVPGSVVLVGGEPGIGKSTLLLQVAAALEGRGLRTLYVSGEESPHQVRLRADRLAADAGAVTLLPETALEPILERAAAAAPAALFVDSIQTVHTADLDGAPGNVGQVRECAARLQRFAKESGTSVFLVGHVTRDGGIAGPRTLEHIVDTVLYFEAAGGLDHRVVRATKNRFGSSDEIAVLRMTSAGLEPVGNPSALFLGDRSGTASGSAVVAALEGTRPILLEVQALATKAAYGAAQRVSAGLDPRRLAVLLAVLEKRAGMPFGQLDVFLNVAGGLRLVETAGDLGVVAALASSVVDRALPGDAVFLGEIGLGGEVRPVPQVERRLAEAARMGFCTAYLAPRAVPGAVPAGMRVVPVAQLRAMIDELLRG
jgi:DNA repair protein RadA/Sms